MEENINYYRIAAAIDYIRQNFREQPNLDEVAGKVNLSPFHFQRLFNEWAGTSPKKFLQYISLDYARKLLRNEQATLFDTAFVTGLSGTSRLHDLFITIEGMTPAEYKNGGKNLKISYNFAETPFGMLLVGSTTAGICYMAFTQNEVAGIKDLSEKFPQAIFSLQSDIHQQNALAIFKNDWSNMPQIKLHLKGTEFQLKVWEALLKIPFGKLSTYGDIAKKTGDSNAARAVGSAIGSNPVAYLIPCHRVIQSSGFFGDYRWGSTRKCAMIGWEGVKCHKFL
jgi:AraC family transcriptional regulator, regulatory protein of adaptative response / methylated-DNA-[protein]-cysteine methyltransferase